MFLNVLPAAAAVVSSSSFRRRRHRRNQASTGPSLSSKFCPPRLSPSPRPIPTSTPTSTSSSAPLGPGQASTFFPPRLFLRLHVRDRSMFGLYRLPIHRLLVVVHELDLKSSLDLPKAMSVSRIQAFQSHVRSTGFKLSIFARSSRPTSFKAQGLRLLRRLRAAPCCLDLCRPLRWTPSPPSTLDLRLRQCQWNDLWTFMFLKCPFCEVKIYGIIYIYM